MKKLISITVAFVLVFLTCVPAFSADKNISENSEKPLLISGKTVMICAVTGGALPLPGDFLAKQAICP